MLRFIFNRRKKIKPFVHAKNSVKRYGGKIEDYMHIHEWFDKTKSADANFYHRAILHNSFGIYLCEEKYGSTLVNSDGKTISVRDIAEDHVKEDCGGIIPTLAMWLSSIEKKPWMLGVGQKAFAKMHGMESD